MKLPKGHPYEVPCAQLSFATNARYLIGDFMI